MCGTCGCKSAESGKKNCGCGQDPCITYGAETFEARTKRKSITDPFVEFDEVTFMPKTDTDELREDMAHSKMVSVPDGKHLGRGRYDRHKRKRKGHKRQNNPKKTDYDNTSLGHDFYKKMQHGKEDMRRLDFNAESTCASCGEGIDEDDIIGDGTNRGLCCVPDYYDEPEMVHCSFCSKIIGTEEEVYDEESVEWYNANGETICPTCHKQREEELRNDLDPHYSPFYAENERPQGMSYFFVYVPSETGRYGREGEKYDVQYFRTLEEAQKAFGKSYEIYEYRDLDDIPPEEREKQEQDWEEWHDRSKKGEFFEDFWWKDEMSRYSNSDAERLHHSTYDSSVENDERDGFYEKTILPSEPSRREQEINRYLADDLGISETLAELLNASRTFGMYITQRAHPDTVKKYRQRILDGFDAYSPESKKEQKIVKMVRQNMATRGVKGPRPSYASSSLGVLRKPELSYYYDDYYDNPIPFMGYELTDEEKKIIGDVKSAENEKPFWENITMSSQKKKEISPLYQGLIASGLVIVALRIMDKVKK
mgnify:CR=1 FL=1|tara:strand:- start:717 stop:2330 length:1614 start_codon:yes stop_codon:yes gene_type:complete